MRDSSFDVAVTGMAGRFPGAPDLGSWWARILKGEILTHSYSADELRAAEVAPDISADADYVATRGHLDDVDRFDHSFFGISAREAGLMDPQHRLALEVAWQALEDAGVPPGADERRTAVFASSSGSSYARVLLGQGALDPGTLDDLIHGSETDFMASRISYKLGLTGPALAVQTACSSSLVAVHLAVQALTNGDCDQAVVVAGGLSYPQAGYLHLPGGVLSPTGRCRPMSAAADGVVPGSGVAAVVLRLADDAATDSSAAPYGLILGTAINNDGRAKAGYYAPSPVGQELAIREALAAAGLAGSDIGYLELHGTGTPIGDPIEWSAASNAFLATGARPGQVAVGSAKANVGHLDACAGLVGLIKALLTVRDGQVPPLAGFDELNPLLETDGSPLLVPTRARPWAGPEPRRASVSAFGIGGTNAHLVIEQPSAPSGGEADGSGGGGRALLAWSAADEPAADRLASVLAERLEQDTALSPYDVAHSLTRSRLGLAVRRFVVADRDGAAAALRANTSVGDEHESSSSLMMVFPGQSGQFPGMARPYAQELPGFVDALDDVLRPLPVVLRDRVRSALDGADVTAEELDQTALAQPALVSLQLAAALALESVGVGADATIGHSLGELSAAVGAGILARDAAVLFAADRGAAMQAAPEGGMLALGCDVDRARELIEGSGLEIASINGADSCVVAGPLDDVAALHARVDGKLFSRRLQTTRAFHSHLIDVALPAIHQAAEGLHLGAASAVFASASDARLVEPGNTVSTSIWTSQARQPVLFSATVALLAQRLDSPVALEVGPGRGLSMVIEQAGVAAVALNPGLRPDADGAVLRGLGELWARGRDVDLGQLTAGRPVRLPTYPFARPLIEAPRLSGRAPSDQPVVAVPANQVAEPAAPPTAEEAVTKAWLALFGVNELPANADFFELGGDSLLITRLARSLRTDLGIRVPIRRLLIESQLSRQIDMVAAELAAHQEPEAAASS